MSSIGSASAMIGGASVGSALAGGTASISVTGIGSGSITGRTTLTMGTAVVGATRRSGIGAFSGWKPVAITVIFTASASDSFTITPKLICTSSHSAASRMIEQASL